MAAVFPPKGRAGLVFHKTNVSFKHFQEVVSVKLKSLAVLVVLVLGCSAAFAQGSFSFGFLSSSAVNEYCNYESFSTGGSGNFYMQGYDVLSACPYSPISGAAIEGVAINVPIAAFAPVHGKAYVYADQIEDAYYGAYTGLQWMVITKTAPTKLQFGNESWAGYLGAFGYEFLGNYGFLTNTLPAAASKATNGKSTIGKLGVAQAKAMIGKQLVK
jgi:hypothetical protein